jgi:hypothetical protein
MKKETPNYIFTTPPDSGVAPLNIFQKPVKGAPYVVINIPTPTDVAALKDLLNEN